MWWDEPKRETGGTCVETPALLLRAKIKGKFEG